MKRKSTTRQRLLSMVTVVTMISALVGAVAVEMPPNEAFTTTTAFAKAGNNYESNQSLSPINECGNGNLPLDVLCKNLGSEVYGGKNSANLFGTQISDATRNGHGNGGGGSDHMNMETGVLIYTHGFPNDPLTFKPDIQKLATIEYDTELGQNLFGEKITHMPYTWDYGLMSLDKTLQLASPLQQQSSSGQVISDDINNNDNTVNDNNYAIFLYTDMFGPGSTVIHNVTRGVFGGIEQYKYCPGITIDESNSHMFDSEHQNFTVVVEEYGPLCFYMGQITIPADKFSDSTLVFAEPARPDHPILREIFLKQVSEVSTLPAKEIVVLVGHGAESDTNDNAQKQELSCAANFVQNTMGFAGSTGVTAREDWHDLSMIAVDEAVNRIQTLLQSTGAEKVILVPATGSGSGFNMISEALTENNIPFTATPETLPLGEPEFREWAQQTISETLDFNNTEHPTESTITPQWQRTYQCSMGNSDEGGELPSSPVNGGHNGN